MWLPKFYRFEAKGLSPLGFCLSHPWQCLTNTFLCFSRSQLAATLLAYTWATEPKLASHVTIHCWNVGQMKTTSMVGVMMDKQTYQRIGQFQGHSAPRQLATSLLPCVMLRLAILAAAFFPVVFSQATSNAKCTVTSLSWVRYIS